MKTLPELRLAELAKQLEEMHNWVQATQICNNDMLCNLVREIDQTLQNISSYEH